MYKIPTLLTGVEQEVVFNGSIDEKADTNILTGANGTLTCSKEVNEQMECKAEYKNIQINQDLAVAQISKVSMSGVEKMGRISVMKSFSSEPVGIIKY